MRRWWTATFLTLSVALITATLGCGGLGRKPPEGPIQEDGPGAQPAEGGWTHAKIRDARSRDAVCNNGGSATYFFVEGQGAHRDDFVIFLKGGGGCGTVDECKQREEQQPGFMRPWGPARAPDSAGLMSGRPADNPDFHDWTRVFVPYCSSDSWMGDKGASPSNGNFHFRGSRIVEALVEDLRDQGLPNGGPELGEGKLLFTGGSAGAMGMRMNLDRVAAMLPDAEWVKGAGDGFVVPEREPTPQMKVELRKRYVDMQALRPDDSCVAVHPDEPWLCTETRNIRKYVDTPFFTYMDVLDSNLMARVGLKRGSPEAREYAEEIREELVKLGSGVFASAKGYHVVVVTERFHDLEVEVGGRELTYAEVLGNWVFGRSGPKECVPTRDGGGKPRRRR